MSDHGKEEHAEIRRLLDEVDGKDPAEQSIFAAFGEIIVNVDSHVADEEGTMFPKLRAGLSREELLDLGRKSEEKAEAVAPTHPHPTTPGGKVGATVVGGMAGVFNKARDRLTGR